MAYDQQEKDPFAKYDHLFDEQDRKYNKKENTRYKKEVRKKEPVFSSVTPQQRGKEADKKMVIITFVSIFVFFMIFRFIKMDVNYRGYFPVFFVGMFIYSMYKYAKKGDK